MKSYHLIVTFAALAFTAGCGEAPPAVKPPEARATPKLVENPPEPEPSHGPGDGHNHGPGGGHGPGDGHNHGPGDGHDHGPGDGHNHPSPSPSPKAPQEARNHGYSPDGKPGK